MNGTVARLLPLGAALVVAAACANPGFSGHQNPRQYLAPAMRMTLPARPASYLGVYEAGVPQSYRLIDTFTSAVGHAPNLVLYYSSWGERFQAAFAGKLLAHGAAPLVQIDPAGVSVSAIAAGEYDGYLRSYAAQVRAFGHPVVIGFGHEMNGWWYSWGRSHVPAHTWVGAWRHIVTVFRQDGADNVTWLWTVNVISGSKIPSPDKWWPGSTYVDWVGIDGYYRRAGRNFWKIFYPTVADLRRLTTKPVLLAEMAISPKDGPARQIPILFAEVRKLHLLGLVWFDTAAKENWRLEDDPAALRAFRQQLGHYRWAGSAADG